MDEQGHESLERRPRSSPTCATRNAEYLLLTRRHATQVNTSKYPQAGQASTENRKTQSAMIDSEACSGIGSDQRARETTNISRSHGKGKRTDSNDCMRKRKSPRPTILEFRFKAVHTERGKTARGEDGYKRLCERAQRRHHFFLHSAHTTKPKDLERLASIFVFRTKQAFCGSGWSFDRSEPLSRIGASDGHPVVDTQTAGFYSLQT